MCKRYIPARILRFLARKMITAVGSGSYELLEQGATCCSFVETREKITAVGAGAVAMAATSMWKQVSHVFLFVGARGKITAVGAGAVAVVAAINLWKQVSHVFFSQERAEKSPGSTQAQWQLQTCGDRCHLPRL